MPNLDNTFLVSVADVFAFSTDGNDTLLFQAKALSESGISISMDSTEVRGGQNNGLRYVFHHSRGVELTMSSVAFSQNFLASNLGSTIVNGAQDVFKEECRIVDASLQITLSETPTTGALVSVVNPNGTISQYTPAGSVVTLTGVVEGDKVSAIYRYSDEVDRITINATTEPDIVKLVLKAQVRDNNGNPTDELNIEIPSFQVNGNYELTLTADTVSSEQLNGMALQVASTDCATDDVYGYFDWVPSTATTIPLAFIAAQPSPILAAANTTQQLTVYGVRGGKFENAIITADCTYAMKVGSDPDLSVDANGLVTIAPTATTGDTGIVEISYNDGFTTHTDEVPIEVS